MSDRKVAKLGDTEQFGVVTFHLRGREITVSEMPAEDYEEALRAAAVIGEDGKPTDRTDMLVFDKLLAVGSVKVDGKEVDIEDWGGKGNDRWYTYPVTQRILTEVKKLHWVDLETDEEKAAREKAAREQAKKDSAKTAESDVPNS